MKCSLLVLSSYLDDELEAGRRAEVEAHLVGCDRCRKGLDCLREETERFGALGRVHVPDSAISPFMQQLGLIGPDDVLPPRPPRPSGPAGRDLPPWLGGGGAGQTLPWMPRHDADDQPDVDQPSLPFTDAFSPAGLTLTSPPSGEPSEGAEIDLDGRSMAAATPSPAPASVLLRSDAQGPSSSHWPPGSVALEGISTWRVGHDVPAESAGVEVEETRVVTEEPPESTQSDVPSPRPSPDARDDLAVTAAPLPTSPPSVALSPPSETPSSPQAPLPPPPDAPSHPSDAAEMHAVSSDDDDDPWSWAPRDGKPTPRSPIHPVSTSPMTTGSGFSSTSAAAVAHDVRGMDALEVGPWHHEQGTAPDLLIDPLIAWVAQPPQPVPPTLISRLRDQVALRLALRRGTDLDDASEPAHGALPHDGRSRSPESVGPLVAAMRSSVHLSPEDAEDGEPVELGGRAATAAWEPPDPDRAGEPPWPEVPFHPVTIAEELPHATGPPRVRDLDRGPRVPGRHARRLGDRRGRFGVAGGSVAQMAGRFGELPHHVRRLAVRPRRGWFAIALVAVLAVMGSLVISHVGTSPSAGVASTRPTSRAASTPHVSLAPKVQPVTVVRPSASVAPTATATPTPTPTPTPAATAQTYGSGGSGWQLQGIRIGTGAGYTRIVFDLGGSSGAHPTATVSFPTPTTMVVTFPGVTAPGSPAAGGSGGLVSDVTRQSGSQLAFRLSLTKAATVQDGGYLDGADTESSAPLHLYFDLG
jgi:hypothetical protein